MANRGFQEMQRAYLAGENNMYTTLKTEGNGEKRHLRAMCYLMENGIFPKPIVLKRLEDGYEIMDGNHRMLAWASGRKLLKELQAVPEQRRKELAHKLSTKWGVSTLLPISDIQRVWIASFS